MRRTLETLVLCATAAFCQTAMAQRQNTAFLFTGNVDASIKKSADTCDFEFSLWDAPEGGTRVGRTLVFDGWEANQPRVPIIKNKFEVSLDFGLPLEETEYLWLESRCSCGRGSSWITLHERAEVNEEMFYALANEEFDPVVTLDSRPNPRPIQILNPDLIDNVIAGTPDGHSLDAADGDPVDAVFVDNDGNVGVGTLSPTSTLEVAGDLTVDGPIRIDGDNNPLEIYVNGTRALRFEYSDALSEAPNFIAGHPENAVVPGKAGATIGGGGGTGIGKNQVSEDWGTVSGGKGNHAFGMLGTVGGGADNTATGEGSTVSGGMDGNAVGAHSIVSGGLSNEATGDYSLTGGGTTNAAGGRSSTIAGGESNVTVGSYATVPGGFGNRAGGNYSFAAGRRAKANHLGSFVWGDSTAADFASTQNNQFRVRASGGASFSHNVGIGTTNSGIALTFANVLGNKISLWGGDGATDHYGFGIQSSTLQMYAPTSAMLAFGHGRSDSFTERMRIASNGFMGIGNLNPGHMLHVKPAATINNWLARFQNGASNVYLAHGTGHGVHINTGGTNSSARYALQVRNATRDHLYVRDDGRVGIGTTAPAYTLDVRGDARATGNIVTGGLLQTANQNFKIRRGSVTVNWEVTPGALWYWGAFGFGTTFSSNPQVLVSIEGLETDGTSRIVALSVYAVTKTSFVFKIRHIGGATVPANTMKLTWMAIGQ